MEITTAEITRRVNIGVEMITSGAYTPDDLTAHLVQIIKDSLSDVSDLTRVQIDRIEKLMFNVEEVRDLQRKYYNGHKQVLGSCKLKERELDGKIKWLLSTGNYSLEKYKNKTVQNSLFK